MFVRSLALPQVELCEPSALFRPAQLPTTTRSRRIQNRERHTHTHITNLPKMHIQYSIHHSFTEVYKPNMSHTNQEKSRINPLDLKISVARHIPSILTSYNTPPRIACHSRHASLMLSKHNNEEGTRDTGINHIKITTASLRIRKIDI